MELKIQLLVRFAFESHREARRLTRKWGKGDTLAHWYHGRAAAYLIAARMFKGGVEAGVRNERLRTAA